MRSIVYSCSLILLPLVNGFLGNRLSHYTDAGKAKLFMIIIIIKFYK